MKSKTTAKKENKHVWGRGYAIGKPIRNKKASSKRLKDTEIKYDVKIKVIQKHIKDGSSHSNIPYSILLEVADGLRSMSTCFPYSKKGKNELIKTLRKECYL